MTNKTGGVLIYIFLFIFLIAFVYYILVILPTIYEENELDKQYRIQQNFYKVYSILQDYYDKYQGYPISKNPTKILSLQTIKIPSRLQHDCDFLIYRSDGERYILGYNKKGNDYSVKEPFYKKEIPTLTDLASDLYNPSNGIFSSGMLTLGVSIDDKKEYRFSPTGLYYKNHEELKEFMLNRNYIYLSVE